MSRPLSRWPIVGQSSNHQRDRERYADNNEQHCDGDRDEDPTHDAHCRRLSLRPALMRACAFQRDRHIDL